MNTVLLIGIIICIGIIGFMAWALVYVGKNYNRFPPKDDDYQMFI